MLPVEVLAGLGVSFAVFLTICAFQLTDGILSRPHRMIWRCIKGGSIVYLCFLIFVSFQKLDNIRWALGVIDNRIGKPLPEVSYAEDCSMDQFWKSIDVFVACHFIGWFVKALIIRDFWLCWFLQLLFEWMEISLRHILPNFWECWWDHLLLDVFGCNAFGIFLGMYLVKKLNMKGYKWRIHSQSWAAIADVASESSSPSKKDDESVPVTSPSKRAEILNKIMNPPSIPSPTTKINPKVILGHQKAGENADSAFWWTTYSWPGPFVSFESFILISLMCVTVNVLDLNLFFIKSALWVPTNHWINGSRTIFLACAAAAATREIYEYLTDMNRKRLGSQAVIGFSCVYMETVLAFMLSDGLPKADPTPTFVKIAWVIIAIVWTSVAVFLFCTRRLKWFPPVEAAKAAGVDAKIAAEAVERYFKSELSSSAAAATAATTTAATTTAATTAAAVTVTAVEKTPKKQTAAAAANVDEDATVGLSGPASAPRKRNNNANNN